MRVIPTNELIELIALFVTLMIFFSIDAKHRFSRDSKHPRNRRFFAITSIIGVLTTVIAAVISWVEFFLESGTFIAMLLILIQEASHFLPHCFLALMCC